MKIAIGSDHWGFDLKRQINFLLASTGIEVVDFGTYSHTECDYPDFAIPVGRTVATRLADRGILIGATGIGMAIVANKIHSIRAVVAETQFEVEMARQQEDANVLCLGAGARELRGILEAWISVPFESEIDGHPSRHARRVQKIAEFET